MTGTKKSPAVLVTGASGFIANHCIWQLLEKGYRVRGTLRTLARAEQLRPLFTPLLQYEDQLTFVYADLTRDEGWDQAAQGCDYLLHVASPLPLGQPKNEDDLIVPAREGTLRALRAAAAAGVKRAVLTSSIAAIMEGHDSQSKVYDERDWSNLDGKIAPYAKSKTIAEQAAWAFIQGQNVRSAMELAVINPSLVLGPLLDPSHVNTSIELIRRFLSGAYPGSPRLNYNLVDVRDVAAAHLAAMTAPAAAGKRFICSGGAVWMVEINQVLHQHFSGQGYKVPTRKLPDFLIRVAALFDAGSRRILPHLGREYKLDNGRLIRELSWQPRSIENTLVDTATSLIDLGIVSS